MTNQERMAYLMGELKRINSRLIEVTTSKIENALFNKLNGGTSSHLDQRIVELTRTQKHLLESIDEVNVKINQASLR